MFRAAMLLVPKGEPAMIKRILVPLDGSERAEYVLPLAARLARHTGGTLVLVRVVNIATSYWPAVATPYPLMMQAVVDAEVEEAATYLETVATRPLLAGLEITTTARYGAATPVILATAMEYHADLIVMCSHGYIGITHVMMGSVAEKVARHASVPVLIVRDNAGLPEVSPAEISQPLCMLVPLDGSAYAEAALEPAATLLAALAEPAQKAVIHLVRVVEVADEMSEIQREGRDLSRAKRHLSRITELIEEGSIAPTISEQHIAVSWSVALDTDVARAIVRVAEYGEDVAGAGVFGGCGLIAIARHGRGGLLRLAMGSVTERVLHTTKRPLLIVRPSEVVNERTHFLEEEESVLGYRLA